MTGTAFGDAKRFLDTHDAPLPMLGATGVLQAPAATCAAEQPRRQSAIATTAGGAFEKPAHRTTCRPRTTGLRRKAEIQPLAVEAYPSSSVCG